MLTNAHVVGGASVVESGWVATSAGVIADFGPGAPPSAVRAGRQIVDLHGATVLPGFVDVHVHGALGHDVMHADVDGLRAMARYFAVRGVTAFLATTWTASTEDTMRALGAVAEVMDGPVSGAQLLGVHLEGPYLNRDRCGAQDPDQVRDPDLAEARRFLQTGVVRLMTLAPELPGARELARMCGDHGVRVSVGHTAATYEQVIEAVSWGARHVTHTFNAMPSLHHRRPGPVGAAIVCPQLLAELIADNHHVHPAVLASFVRAKGAAGVVLVTDALSPTGLRGDERHDERGISVADGVVRLADGTMAGSVLTMDVALRNLIQATGSTVTELWPTASRNGAIAAGVGDRKGLVAVGMDADLVVVGADVDVGMTVVAGQIV